MWELSTPFVYMRWFLFTLGKSGSKAYIVNGLLMVGTFFLARNVFGTCEPQHMCDTDMRQDLQPT